MIAFISLIYASFYLLFFDKLKVFKKSARNISIFVGVGVVLVGTIVIMWLTYAPTTQDGAATPTHPRAVRPGSASTAAAGSTSCMPMRP